MELNKTSESLFSMKADNRVEHHHEPQPKDQREVKTFVLENKPNRTEPRRGSSLQSKERRDGRASDSRETKAPVSSKRNHDDMDKDSGAHVSDQAVASVNVHSMFSDVVLSVESGVALSGADLQWVEELILSTVESMLISDVNGQQLVEVVLDNSNLVPEPFCGVNLTLVQNGSDISVSFSNFLDQGQLADALGLVMANPQNLADLVGSLRNHHLFLKELSIGTNVVQLPKIEEVQSPFHMIAAAIRNQDHEQDQEGKRDSQDQQQEQGSFAQDNVEV